MSRSPEETVEAGADFGALLAPGDVVAVHGDLGAGKTTFVRGLVRGLAQGPAQGMAQGPVHTPGDEFMVVTSPTFSIVHTYSAGGVVVHHVDAFRVASEAELDELGFDEYLDGTAVVIVEWPARIGSRLPHDAIHFTLQHIDMDDGVRRISAGAPDP
jgi:tRNA threonylcarbamoyl adenosine modification protein YjeE